jgi:hypothetical protein
MGFWAHRIYILDHKNRQEISFLYDKLSASQKGILSVDWLCIFTINKEKYCVLNIVI